MLYEAAIFDNSLKLKEKSMTNFNVFDFHKLDPFAIGFNKMLEDLQNSVEKIPSYPPYNIRQVKDNKYVIEMAVAGFGKSDVEITLDGNKLDRKSTRLNSSHT